MLHDTQRGTFWIPDKPEHPVQGTLSVNDAGRLELTTWHLENSFRDIFLPYFERDHSPKTITGVTTNGNIAFIKPRPLGRKTSINTYLVETPANLGLPLRLARAKPTHPLLWRRTFPPWKSTSSPYQFGHGTGSTYNWTGTTDILSWPTKWEPHLHTWSFGEIGIQYRGRLSGLDTKSSFNRAELTIDTSFLVNFDEPRDVEDVLDIVSTLQSLVSVATGEPVAVEKILLTVADAETNNKALFHYSPMLRPVLPGPEDSPLFTFDEIGGAEGAAKWTSCLYDQPYVKNGLLIDRYHRPALVTDVTPAPAPSLRSLPTQNNQQDPGPNAI